MSEVKSFRDLRVYQELLALHLLVHEISLTFPKFETYELGSQIRRSSNSAPAQIAEGWGSRHTNIYIEAINRALGEVRETQHHLMVAFRKRYVEKDQFESLDQRYEGCGRMLEKLHQSLSAYEGSVRRPGLLREEPAEYMLRDSEDRVWSRAMETSFDIDRETPSFQDPEPNT